VNPLPVTAGAAAAWGLAALIAVTCGSTRAGIRVCCAVSGVAGAAALAGGVSALLSGNSRVVTAGGSVVVGTLQLQATSLAGVFVALLGLIAIATAAYVPRYHKPGHATGLYLGVFNLAMLASLAVLVAGNVVTFLVAWETMALLCYLLILRRPRRPEVAAGAFWFLALSEVGFVAIVAAFVILAAK
jgi:hydrogenase-4 component B